MTDSLNIARGKLTRVLAIYTPMHNAAGAQSAMTAALAEFEAAVRADERIAAGAQLEAAQRATNDALAAGAQAAAQVHAHAQAAAAAVTGPVADLPILATAPIVPPALNTAVPGVDAPAARSGRKRGG